MPGTLFFVHGTGVRKAGYEATLDRIRSGCAKQPRLRDITVADNCSWGEEVGTRTDLIGRTLPPEDRTRAILGTVSPEDLDTARWSLLLDDPLFELRVASQQPPQAVSAIGRQAADAALAAALERFKADPPAAMSGVSPERLREGAAQVALAPELSGAANAAGIAEDKDLVDATARAIVAFALQPADDLAPRPTAALNATARDAVVGEVARRLAPTTRAAGSWLRDRTADIARGLATRALRDRRHGLTHDALAKAGDVLFHLRRGSGVLDFIVERMQPWPRPIVAVGHSLGGVMLVDLLSRPDHPAVAALITVGSQAPLLYAVDSLEALRPGDHVVKPFVPWLNIYDRADFLSYVAGDLFGADGNVRDAEVRSGVPFPDSHGAYWEQDATYAFIAGAWPQHRIPDA